jgi:hypothetical protein
MVSNGKYFDDLVGDVVVRTVLEQKNINDQHPSISKLIEYVWSKAKDRQRPKRSEFEPKEIQSILPFISIFEPIYENDEFVNAKIRLIGTELVIRYGEITGSKVLDYALKVIVGRAMADCKLVVDTKDIVVTGTSTLDQQQKYIKMRKVLIPFFDDELHQDKVTQIIILCAFSS